MTTTETTSTEKTSPHRLTGTVPRAAIDARLQRAKYRQCAKAAALLKEHGWTVEPPDDWESPEHLKVKSDFEKAMAALKSMGIDPITLLNSNGQSDTADGPEGDLPEGFSDETDADDDADGDGGDGGDGFRDADDDADDLAETVAQVEEVAPPKSTPKPTAPKRGAAAQTRTTRAPSRRR